MASTTTSSDIRLRPALPTDDLALERLAQLDSRHVPAGDMVVAEIDGTLVAAVESRTGVAIADPFRPTAELVELLRRHAVTERSRRTRSRRLRPALA